MTLNFQLARKYVLIAARILDALILAFLLVFLLGHAFGDEESGAALISARDMIQFLCFPLSLIVGLAIAWKWEGTGGLIATTGMILLFIIRPDLMKDLFMLLLLVPGLLFILYRYLEGKH